jgi:hypothetical protein
MSKPSGEEVVEWKTCFLSAFSTVRPCISLWDYWPPLQVLGKKKQVQQDEVLRLRYLSNPLFGNATVGEDHHECRELNPLMSDRQARIANYVPIRYDSVGFRFPSGFVLRLVWTKYLRRHGIVRTALSSSEFLDFSEKPSNITLIMTPVPARKPPIPTAGGTG